MVLKVLLHYTVPNVSITRMHSSRMRTGRTLTVFRSLLIGGGGLVQGGFLPGPGGRGGGFLPGLGVWSRGGSSLVRGGCLVPGGFLPGPRGGSSLVRGGGGRGFLPGLGVWSRGGSSLVRGGVVWSRGGSSLVRGGLLPGPGEVPAWSWGGAWSGTPCEQNDTHV